MPTKKKSPAKKAQEIKAMSLYLPHGMYIKLKILALHQGKPTNSLLVAAVGEYLKGK